MPATRTPRERWIDEGLRALAGGGPDAVRVEVLAKALATTKGSFYWHFKDRAALLDQLLDAWETMSVDEVIADVDAQGAGPRDRLERLFALAASRGDLLPVDLAVRDWARRDRGVARRLRRVDNRRMDYMRSLFRGLVDDEVDVEVRCTLAFAMFIGTHFMAADHGDHSRREIYERALAGLLT